MNQLTEYKGHFGETKEKILEMLLDGPKSSVEIADRLKIQKSAIRSHLESLQSEKSVTSYYKLNIERMGRPRRVYELTEGGRELFTRKYEEILSLVLKKISETNGQEELRKIVESIADEISEDIKYKIQKNGVNSLEERLKILNLLSDEMGFVSSLRKDEDGSFYITSKNCILHKVALKNQDIICHGLHDRIIKKSLEGENSDTKVELMDCIALGSNFSTHKITKTSR
jgi:DeoR family transcriptional regulator, suf operon transcriptional repressor